MVSDVRLVARINFGRGLIGRQQVLASPEDEQQFSGGLKEATRRLTRSNTGDCGDDRRTIGLADGTTDVRVLAERVVPQLFGGLGLSAAKAAYAANAAYLRDAKDFQQAYETTSALLTRFGYEDGGHAVCGASKTVESSVANPIPEAQFNEALGLFIPTTEAVLHLSQQNQQTKRQHLEAGHYGGWSSDWHEDFLSQRFPQNFSHLAVDPSDLETGGHHGVGLYVVTAEGQGFAKNDFIDATGREAFAVTTAIMAELSHKLGYDDEERARIHLGFLDDTLHVGAGLVAPGMPVFAEVA